jgi:hypothetical protein
MANVHETAINVPFPDAGDLQLRFAVGACRLRIRPEDQEGWVSGTYQDPTGNLPFRIDQEGSTVRIVHQPDWINFFGWLSGVPRFDLNLGKAKPYNLTFESGASEASLDLGGLPLTRLAIKHGAGKIEMDFSSPNPEAMSLLSLAAGAGETTARNLANANCAEMVIEGGAASYRFDFGGQLQRDTHVRISSGVSSVELIIPRATAAKVTPESVMGGIDAGDGFTKKEGAFWTEAALAGQSPLLTIQASVALGSLRLRAT